MSDCRSHEGAESLAQAPGRAHENQPQPDQPPARPEGRQRDDHHPSTRRENRGPHTPGGIGITASSLFAVSTLSRHWTAADDQEANKELGVDEIVIVGAVRTTGANPGRAPRPLRFTRKIPAPGRPG